MKKSLNFTSIFLILIGLAFLNVGIQAFYNPQDIMDLVNTKLGNIDAYNSIRAYYGGVNVAFGIYVIYGAFKNQKIALTLLSLYGGGFVVGRLYSILVEGMPGSFIWTWLVIEFVMTVISLYLLSTKFKTPQASIE